MSVNEGNIPRRSWNQLLPPVGATDELNWAEKSVQMSALTAEQPQSLPKAPLVLRHKMRSPGCEAGWTTHAGVCWCLHLGTQSANRLEKVKVTMHSGEKVVPVLPAEIKTKHHESDFQEEDCTWWSLLARCPYSIAITSNSGVSVGSGRNATWQLDCHEDFDFWVSFLGQCFEQT